MEKPNDNAILIYKELLEMLMDDQEIAQELLQEFKIQTDRHFTLLGSYIHSENLNDALREQIKQTAHLLKGSALNIRAPQFAGYMRDIETKAFQYSAAELSQQFRHATRACHTLYDHIQKTLSAN